jgi:hypothetical protein
VEKTVYSGRRQKVLRAGEELPQKYLPARTPVKLRELTFVKGQPAFRHDGANYHVARDAAGWYTTGVIL